MADFRLRVTYAETGRLVMLSHLEVARALERAVRRADLPYAVSQGFSPHMKLAFGAALPVGVGGASEVFDVALTDYVAPERALSQLQAASAADLMPHAARYIAKEDAAASVAFPLSTYEAVLRRADGGDAYAAACALRVPDEVRVVRKKKEKVLRPQDFLVSGLFVERVERGAAAGGSRTVGAVDAEAGSVRAHGSVSCGGEAEAHAGEEAPAALVRFTLEAKPTGSLRPDVLLEHLLAGTGLQATSVMRVAQREKLEE